jgi:hypothetical protein
MQQYSIDKEFELDIEAPIRQDIEGIIEVRLSMEYNCKGGDQRMRSHNSYSVA